MYLLEQVQLWRLPSAAMTVEEDLHAQRLGYWLRRVRVQRGETLESAALAVGLAASSGSTVSLWERGARAIKVQQLRRLAHFYGVPEGFFTHPPMTDDERLAAVLADAAELEQQDWDEGQGGDPSGAAGRASAPRTLH